MSIANPMTLLNQQRSFEITPVPEVELIQQHLQVVEFGLLNGCLVFPNDVLRVGEYSDGDILLLKPTHPTAALLYPGVRFGRKFGEHLLLESPHQPTLNPHHWDVLGAVKGLERPLTNACVGDGHWKIRIFGAEGWVSLDWLNMVQSQPLDAIYLSELAKELSVIPDVSVLAARESDSFDEMPIPNPSTIVFSFHVSEAVSLFARDWEAGSRRRMRQKRRQKRTPKQIPVLYPLPNLREKSQNQGPAVVNKVIPFGDIACK